MFKRSQSVLHRADIKLEPRSLCNLLTAPYLMITLYNSLQIDVVVISDRGIISVYLVNIHRMHSTHLLFLFVLGSSPLRSIWMFRMDRSVSVTCFATFFLLRSGLNCAHVWHARMWAVTSSLKVSQ